MENKLKKEFIKEIIVFNKALYTTITSEASVHRA